MGKLFSIPVDIAAIEVLGKEELSGCSKRPSGKAAASEGAETYSSPYVEPLSDARTRLAGFFSIMLGEKTEDAGMSPAFDRRRFMRVSLPCLLDEVHCRRLAIALMTEPPLRVPSGELLVVHCHLELAHLEAGTLQLRFQLLLLTQHALS